MTLYAKEWQYSPVALPGRSPIHLIVAAAVALAWANSPWGASYTHLWRTPLGIRIGAFTFERTLEWFVNDGLMVIFFFFVGMEIRREIHHGELSEWRRAALPAVAALGGMLTPAAKIGVLVASGSAAICALVLGRLLLSPAGTATAAATADEAESSTEA